MVPDDATLSWLVVGRRSDTPQVPGGGLSWYSNVLTVRLLAPDLVFRVTATWVTSLPFTYYTPQTGYTGGISGVNISLGGDSTPGFGPHLYLCRRGDSWVPRSIHWSAEASDFAYTESLTYDMQVWEDGTFDASIVRKQEGTIIQAIEEKRIQGNLATILAPGSGVGHWSRRQEYGGVPTETYDQDGVGPFGFNNAYPYNVGPCPYEPGHHVSITPP